jgi:hypothetical protein
VYYLYPETAGVRLEDMNTLFGEATTEVATPATLAETGSLMGIGSPASLDIRRGTPQPGMLSTNDAIPGLDIDPPHLEIGEDGKPIRGENSGEGMSGWISRMVNRSTQARNGGGGYGKVAQRDDDD